MRKKILIAEKSDAIRNIAESLLHQHGYDVISSPTADKAKELIITSEPNLVIIDAGLKDQNDAFLYDLLEESEQTAQIPLLIITDTDNADLSYPPEVLLSRPFETNDLLDKVRLFIGPGTEQKPKEKISEADPFSAGNIDDDFLDAALGIDEIDVESSEIMDKTTITEKARQSKDPNESTDIGIAHNNDSENDEDDSGKVESLLIREDGSEQKVPKKEELPDLSASSKLEINTGQYDVTDSKQTSDSDKPPDKKSGDHDYDWFINEMKKDTGNIKFDKGTNDTGSQKIQTTNTSEGLNPINIEKKTEPSAQPEIKSGGVDQFISDFKQEMKQLSPDETKTPGEKPVSYSGEEIKPDINQLADFVAQKIVEQLVAKINKEDISRIIKEYLPQFKGARKSPK